MLDIQYCISIYICILCIYRVKSTDSLWCFSEYTPTIKKPLFLFLSVRPTLIPSLQSHLTVPLNQVSTSPTSPHACAHLISHVHIPLTLITTPNASRSLVKTKSYSLSIRSNGILAPFN